MVEAAQQPPGDVEGVTAVFDEYGELVATESGDGVTRAHAGTQPLADPDEQLVADRMPERVVDCLEVVYVDQQHRYGSHVTTVQRQRVLEPVVEEGAVGQTGEDIVERLVRDPAHQRAVLQEDEHLPADEGRDEERTAHRHLVVQHLAVRRLAQHHEDGGGGRDEGHQQCEPWCDRRLDDLVADVVEDRGDREDQEAGDPARVDEVDGAVVVDRGEVGEAAVADRERDEPGGDPPEAASRAGARVADDDDRDRQQQEVAARVGERDDGGEGGVGAGAVDLAERGAPADDEQRCRDEDRVERDPVAALAGKGGRWPDQQTGEPEDGEHEEADVGEGRERRVPSDEQLVVAPDGLADTPAPGRARDQQPRGSRPVPAVHGAPPGRAGGRERREHLGDVVDGSGQMHATGTQLQVGDEANDQQCAAQGSPTAGPHVAQSAAGDPGKSGRGSLWSEMTTSCRSTVWTGLRRREPWIGRMAAKTGCGTMPGTGGGGPWGGGGGPDRGGEQLPRMVAPTHDNHQRVQRRLRGLPGRRGGSSPP